MGIPLFLSVTAIFPIFDPLPTAFGIVRLFRLTLRRSRGPARGLAPGIFSDRSLRSGMPTAVGRLRLRSASGAPRYSIQPPSVALRDAPTLGGSTAAMKGSIP